MDRLSGLDAMFLHLETPAQPLNVCAIVQLDTSSMPTAYRYDDFCARLSERVAAIAPFQLKLADSQLNLDHPVWVSDTDFRLDRHVHRVGLPSPGGNRELAEICSLLAGGQLPRDRPLWELWVIEHSAQTSSLTVMLKTHHAAVDGVGAATLLAQLCGTAPDAPVPAPVTLAAPASTFKIVTGGLREIAVRPFRVASAIPATVSTAWRTINRARRGVAMAAPFAESSILNGNFTTRRSMAFVDISLTDVKTIKDRFGVTVNDVITTVCAGALREFLGERPKRLSERLIAAVPVAVHEKSDRPGRNQASWLLCALETTIRDPVERLHSTAAHLVNAKGHNAEMAPTLVMDWTQSVSPLVMSALRKVALGLPLPLRPAYHLILSNIPGPQTQLYMMGARLTALYPFGPILAGSALNITAMSLNCRVGIGLMSCPDVIEDIWDLASRFNAALEELLTASPEMPGFPASRSPTSNPASARRRSTTS